MATGKTFAEIYKDIFTKQIPEKFGAALSLPGKVVTAGIGLAAPSLASPAMFAAYKQNGQSTKDAAVNTVTDVSQLQKGFVKDAFAGDVVRQPVQQLAQSNYPLPVKALGIAAMKASEMGSQLAGYQAVGALASNISSKVQEFNIKSSPIPETLLNNEKQHAIDQLVGHAETSLYTPQNQPAADALVKAIDQAKGVPLKDFGRKVLESMPKEYMKDPNVATAVNNWVTNTNNMYEMIKMGLGNGLNYQQSSYLADKMRSADKSYIPYFMSMFKNLGGKK